MSHHANSTLEINVIMVLDDGNRIIDPRGIFLNFQELESFDSDPECRDLGLILG